MGKQILGKSRLIYEIVDQAKLDRYFVGKKPSTKILFLLGVEHNNIGYGVKGDTAPYGCLIGHSQKLQRMGIITKTRAPKAISDEQAIIIKKKKELRKIIKKQIMLVNAETLSSVIDLLSKEARVNE